MGAGGAIFNQGTLALNAVTLTGNTAKGGSARAAKARAKRTPIQPYAKPFLTFLDAVGRGGPTRQTWRIFWRLADGLPLDPGEVESFRLHTGRTTPPTKPATAVWCIAGSPTRTPRCSARRSSRS